MDQLAERHPKVAEIELKDNTKCQRRQRRSSTQAAGQVSGPEIGPSQVVAQGAGPPLHSIERTPIMSPQHTLEKLGENVCK